MSHARRLSCASITSVLSGTLPSGINAVRPTGMPARRATSGHPAPRARSQAGAVAQRYAVRVTHAHHASEHGDLKPTCWCPGSSPVRCLMSGRAASRPRSDAGGVGATRARRSARQALSTGSVNAQRASDRSLGSAMIWTNRRPGACAVSGPERRPSMSAARGEVRRRGRGHDRGVAQRDRRRIGYRRNATGRGEPWVQDQRPSAGTTWDRSARDPALPRLGR